MLMQRLLIARHRLNSPRDSPGSAIPLKHTRLFEDDAQITGALGM